MKNALHEHTEKILETLGAQELAVRIYDCETDSLPAFIYTYEKKSFLICCTYEAAIPDCAWLKRLENFTGKELFMSAQGQEIYIYWFENKSLESATLGNAEERPTLPVRLKKKDKFVTHADLPEYIDRYIFDSLNARYAPDPVAFSDNLTHRKQDVLVYLGTYFPRSYAESFCIFSNMLQNPTILTELQEKRELNLLSVGCGTGGDLLGLLSLITKKLPDVEEVTIHATDGNREALSILEKICSNLSPHWPFQLNVNIHTQIFEEKINAEFLENIEKKFDFILSFKMLGELLRNSDTCKDSYYDFCKEFLPHLSQKGICVILDVTTPAGNGKYLPMLLNAQINNALRELHLYKTLLPLPCNLYGSTCNISDCFSQKNFTVTHSRCKEDKSKVCYRVIAHKDFCDSIVSADRTTRYNIGMVQRIFDENPYDAKICLYTAKHDKEHDGYNLMR